MKKFKHWWIPVGLVGVLVITNPITEQFIGRTIDWLFLQLVLWGAEINAVAVALLVFYLVWLVRPKKLKVPKKTHKTSKAGKFLEA